MQIKDMIGQRFGRLTVIDLAGKRGRRIAWLCKCDCGVDVEVAGVYLRTGKTKSCGCLRRDLGKALGTASRKHGESTNGGSDSVEYRTWTSMIQRCTNSAHRQFAYYGGRGIMVCDRWLGEHGFENFLADMGRRPAGPDRYSIDRIDNDHGYEPWNCRWATHTQQNNNRSDNRHITIDGETRTLAEWMRSGMFDISVKTFHRRIADGWTDEEALLVPALDRGVRARH